MRAGSPSSEAADKLQRSAELIFKHWTLALPTAVASVLVVLVAVFGALTVAAGTFAGSLAAGHLGAGVGFGSALLVAIVALGIAVAALWFAHAMVVAAAPDVLADREPNLGAAAAVVFARAPELVAAFLIFLVLAVVPLALCIVLIGFPLLIALGYFLMYVPAAIVIGGEGALQAIGTSVRLARSRAGESVIAWIGLVIASVVGVVVNGVVSHIPLVNVVVAFGVGGFVAAYDALVLADFYLWLRLPAAPPAGVDPIGGAPTVLR
jgi:hypothetical protein